MEVIKSTGQHSQITSKEQFDNKFRGGGAGPADPETARPMF